MKAKVWVLCTVLSDENAPAMPAVFADEAEARAATQGEAQDQPAIPFKAGRKLA
jgi:hypothetical protein